MRLWAHGRAVGGALFVACTPYPVSWFGVRSNLLKLSIPTDWKFLPDALSERQDTDLSTVRHHKSLYRQNAHSKSHYIPQNLLCLEIHLFSMNNYQKVIPSMKPNQYQSPRNRKK